MRKEDMVGRLGGEEFAVLLSDTDAEVGLRRAESLRETVAARAIDAGLAGDLHITISLGVYELQRSDASAQGDRKSTRLNSSHLVISYAVFCLKKKTSTRLNCRYTL